MKGSNRSPSCSALPFLVPEYEFVISHYKENMDWLAPVANHCHIYHKGGEVIPHFEYRQWQTLPNVGRESHTYLQHIINYLADITVFLQGQLVKNGNAYKNISDYITLAQKNQFTCSHHHRNYRMWGIIKPSHWKHSIIANNTFAKFWQKTFEYPHPPSIELCFGGCFSVTRRLIQQYPITFYKNLIPYVSHSSDPLEDHYFKRLWLSIFTLKLP